MEKSFETFKQDIPEEVLVVEYPIVEIFASIQGEGVMIGTPTTFIRLSGCDLKCSFCDTKESWVKNENYISVKDIIDTCEANGQRYVVITGGEPTIHNIVPLVWALRTAGYMVGMETHGGNSSPALQGIDVVTVSPKPGNNYFVNQDVMEVATEFKLVVNKELDMDNEHIVLIREHCKAISTHRYVRIWLQPDSTNMQENWKLCYDLAMKATDLNVGVQLHRIMEVQ